MESVRARLSAMMFVQYFLWGTWGVAAGGYLGGALKFTGSQIGWIYSTTAIGAMISPLLVGYIADRFFSTERILAFLHLVGGILLFAAAQQTEFEPLFGVMVAYSLFFMPTLALTNSISFRNINKPEEEFPAIRVWGTLGWIAAGWVVGLALNSVSNQIFWLAGVSSIAMAGLCLMLPHTPPRGASAKEPSDVFGLGAISVLKEPAFAVFLICSFLIAIPLAFYYNFANLYLTETDRPAPTALQTLGQISEVFFMAAMPWFIFRLGVKWMLAVGMLAWSVRYVCFATLDFPLVILGIALHGVCYDFFFVASQIYVDKKVPSHMRASAQSLWAFIVLGMGLFVGAQVSGLIVDQYPGMMVAARDAEGKEIVKYVGNPPRAVPAAPLPEWRDPTVKPDSTAVTPPDFVAIQDGEGGNKDGMLQFNEIPSTWTEIKDIDDPKQNVTYDGKVLQEAFDTIDVDHNRSVTRAEWRAAQAHNWPKIWYWPAAMSAVTLILFFLGFHDRMARAPTHEETEKMEAAAEAEKMADATETAS